MKTLSSNLRSLMESKSVSTGFAVKFWSDQISGQSWCFTTLPAGTTIGADTYTPLAMTLDERSGGDGTAQTNALGLDLTPCEPFITYGNPRFGIQFKAIVYEVFTSTDGTITASDMVAEGMVVFSKRTAAVLSLSIKPLVGILDRRVPTVVYSRTDQRTPYSLDFGVDPATHLVTATVDALAQNMLYSSALGAFTDGWFNNGFIAYTVTQAGITITIRVPVIASGRETTGDLRPFVRLAYPPPLLEVADVVEVYFGYDGTRETSQSSKFSNFVATDYNPASNGFLGFPDMPVENPTVTPLNT